MPEYRKFRRMRPDHRKFRRRRPEYEDYQKMILNRAWAWQRRIGKDIDELVAEGNLVFCRCLHDHDKDKSTFSTYLYNSLQMHFGNMVTVAHSLRAAQQKTQEMLDPEQTYGQDFSLHQEVIFRQAIGSLSADAKEMVQAVFETPLEIIEVMGITRMSVCCLRNYFRKQRGWAFKRIGNTISEIQKAIL